MARRRPVVILIVAILHLIFGGLGILCGVCSGILDLAGTRSAFSQSGDPTAAQQAKRKEVTEKVLPQRIPLYKAYTVGNRVSSMLSSVLLVASGIGLLLMQSWGRWLSVVYAILSLLVNFIGFVYTLVFFTPANEEIFRQLPPQSDQERMAYNFSRIVSPGCLCVIMVYPLAVLIIMLLPSVGAAFRARPRRSRLRDDEMME